MKALMKRFRSAITGRFIKKTVAVNNPDTTVSETVEQCDTKKYYVTPKSLLWYPLALNDRED